jgi:hypothetical protein
VRLQSLIFLHCRLEGPSAHLSLPFPPASSPIVLSSSPPLRPRPLQSLIHRHLSSPPSLRSLPATSPYYLPLFLLFVVLVVALFSPFFPVNMGRFLVDDGTVDRLHGLCMGGGLRRDWCVHSSSSSSSETAKLTIRPSNSFARTHRSHHPPPRRSVERYPAAQWARDVDDTCGVGEAGEQGTFSCPPSSSNAVLTKLSFSLPHR